MTWKKRGLIYCPDGGCSWAQHSFMTPTPLQLSDDIIRVYGGLRDEKGVSRIGYIDVSAHDPRQIIAVSQDPVLDIGKPGTFDDNGVILGDILRVNDEIRMYYVGFQLVEKVKFMAFTGLAISNDGGNSFQRFSTVPVMDRSDASPYIRAIHSVIYEDGIYKVWYAIGKGESWQVINGKSYPSYNIWYTESEDGVNFSKKDTTLCIDTEGAEYRIGRPRVYKVNGMYQIFYTRDFIERNYVAGYAESNDGKKWYRKDKSFGIEKSSEGWDSQMICYPVILSTRSKSYMFYNGNDFGKTGVGYAEFVRD